MTQDSNGGISRHDTICRRCKGTGRMAVVGFVDRKPRGTATCMSCLGHGSVEAMRDALLAAARRGVRAWV